MTILALIVCLQCITEHQAILNNVQLNGVPSVLLLFEFSESHQCSSVDYKGIIGQKRRLSAPLCAGYSTVYQNTLVKDSCCLTVIVPAFSRLSQTLQNIENFWLRSGVKFDSLQVFLMTLLIVALVMLILQVLQQGFLQVQVLRYLQTGAYLSLIHIWRCRRRG